MQYNQTKATQKKYEYAHYGRPFRSEAMDLKDWWNYQLNKFRNNGGIVVPGKQNGEDAWKIVNPKSGKTVIVGMAEIEADYKRCYLRQK